VGLSLQDQLLKAGLVDKSKANKARKEQQKQARQQRNTKGPVTSEADQQRHREQADKAARDRELNHKRNEARNQREIAAQVRQLVEHNRHPRSDSEEDTAFYFENKGKIKQIYVSAQTHKMITSGKLAIVNCNGVFEIVPSDVAKKIRQRNPGLVIELPEEQKPDKDALYSEHQVPDDLMW